MNKPSTKRKGGLIQELIDHGIGVRRARKAVNAVFDCMTQGVRRGEVVEIPGGTIRATTRQGKRRQRFQWLRNVNTGEDRLKIVSYPGRRRVVKFRPDEGLDLTPLPAPPTPEEIECRELASQLLGFRVNDQVMASLQAAADVHQPKPGRLLRRLRECRNRGWTNVSVQGLVENILRLYWI
jgi:nucleoid DNA-binding protein